MLLYRDRVLLGSWVDVSPLDGWGLQYLTILEPNLAGEARLFHNKFGGLVIKVSKGGIDILLRQTFLDLGVAFHGVDLLQISEDLTFTDTTHESRNVFDSLFVVDFLPFCGYFFVFMLYNGAFIINWEICEYFGHIDILKRALRVLGLL